jgi:hypothetical protein
MHICLYHYYRKTDIDWFKFHDNSTMCRHKHLKTVHLRICMTSHNYEIVPAEILPLFLLCKQQRLALHSFIQILHCILLL